MVRIARKMIATATLAGGTLFLAPAATAGAQQTQTKVTVKHHSILKGAVVGAVVGAVGGHLTHHKHGTLIGAAVGAGIQHHRNKKPN